ncbi:hypothetical protein V490_09375 [Pseudogymnoascus sp. VKM F-3557]|nr:hypothetical protein V490_09375 [Pseudogymnoascus sp. VKM F-3557]
MSHSIRSHRKSRTGCNICKIRRVKCNEAKPHCTGCIRGGYECLYAANVIVNRQANPPVQSNSSVPKDHIDLQPMPSFQRLSEGSVYSAKHILDIRLMHHYCIFTAKYFAGTFPEKVSIALTVDIPQLGFKHEFLMDAILLVSMTHLSCTEPVTTETLPVYLYRDQALRSLRRAVADISSQTFRAIRGASVLLATVSLAADRITKQPDLWTANWMTLALGQRNFHTPTSPPQHSTTTPNQDDMESPSNRYGSFTDIPAPGTIVADIQRALYSKGNDCAHLETLHKDAMELSRLIAVLEHPYEESWLEKKIKAWAFDVVSPEFVELVRQAQPLALIILAYYLALFRFLPDTWTYQGVATHDIDEIYNTIDPAWVGYISVPKMALQINDRTALAQMLTGRLEQAFAKTL